MAEQKKALQLASVASMIDQFNIPNIQILLDLGYKVDVVADFAHPGTITNDRAEDLKSRLNDMGVRVIDIAIPRSLNPRAVMSAYKQVKKLITTSYIVTVLLVELSVDKQLRVKERMEPRLFIQPTVSIFMTEHRLRTG